jgi:hypothetical protein
MKRVLLAASIAATLVGCAAPQRQVVQRPPFPEAEYAMLEKEGTATVTGQAFLKTRGGDVKTGAGNFVYLNPATTYSKFLYDRRNQSVSFSPPDTRLLVYVRKTVADASGRFNFKNVPAGEYYVTGEVIWEAPVGYQGSLVRQGGVIWKLVSVQEGEAVEVMVTQ